ncbi:hypothetical protein DRJ48_03135 [Candidatus Woesearchaeota archaeon]|nr:MAG: hypothetical protein DRJ48_03135 [Candidatus Woesearchaeota archaeon]
MEWKWLVSLLILGVLFAFGCAQKAQINQTSVYVSFFNETEENVTPEKVIVEEVNVTPEEVPVEEAPTTVEEEEVAPVEEVQPSPAPVEEVPEGIPVKRFVEGELVELSVKAVDPDNDQLTVMYSKPLDENGRWQTEIGDAGQYRVNISVSDGKTVVSKEVLLIIEPKNKPPVIEIPDEITVKEGETVKLEPVITDPDNDEVTVTYTGWMDSPTYTTGYEDAGSYIVTIIASDGLNSVAKDVKVNVINVNRAPVIAQIQPVKVTEGALVNISPEVSDPDGDEVSISFSEPLDENGQWQTKEGDAGEYEVIITATDGKAVTTSKVKISVEPLNRPPVIQRIPDIVVNEGEIVKIEPVIIDPDGDSFTVSYSGWMHSDTKVTTYQDAGTYTVTVTATDSKGASSSLDVKVTVNDVNRPPELVIE